MSQRLKVLFLPLPDLFERWGNDVVAAVTRKHDLRIADYDQPLAPQFEGIDAVIDHGGSVGTREMVDLAAAARSVTGRSWEPDSTTSTSNIGRRRECRSPTAPEPSAPWPWPTAP